MVAEKKKKVVKKVAKPKAVELAKVNKDRSKAMAKFLTPEEITLAEESLALGELEEHGLEELNQYVYSQCFDKGKPSVAVINTLMREKKLSPLAANYVVNTLVRECTGTLNCYQEYHQNLVVINTNIARLIGHVESTEADGAEGANVASLFAELRQWLSLKSNVINNAFSNQLQSQSVQVENKKADALSAMSDADLMRALRDLGGI